MSRHSVLRPEDRVPEAVLLGDRGSGFGIELDSVGLREVSEESRHLFRDHLVRLDLRAELAEQALETARRDDLQDPAGLVARVPEGVPLVAGLEHQVADLRVHDLAAELSAHAALDHEAVLVLASVAVEWSGE